MQVGRSYSSKYLVWRGREISGESLDVRAVDEAIANEEISEEDKRLRHFGRTFRALIECLKETSDENWDGYGASAINWESFKNALQFILNLPLEVPPPDVSVDPDGEISLEWYRNPRKIFSVSIGADGTLAYAGIWEKEEEHGTVYWKRGKLPRQILNWIRKIFRPLPKIEEGIITPTRVSFSESERGFYPTNLRYASG